jgi:hypothetical protein
MALFAIGDLHLSFSSNKPMDVFGQNWSDYENKIKASWLEQIDVSDTVLIPGDISWAMRLEDAKVDLQWIHELPGRKIMLRGNHDYWWTSLKKLQVLYDEMDFLQNNYFTYSSNGETYAICGTRGWLCPNPNKFEENDLKIYKREMLRLRLSLDRAAEDGHTKFIVMTHYPPTNDMKAYSGFQEIYEAYGVKKVVYGHLHSEYAFTLGLQGVHNGVEYQLVSSDYLDFQPVKIME